MTLFSPPIVVAQCAIDLEPSTGARQLVTSMRVDGANIQATVERKAARPGEASWRQELRLSVRPPLVAELDGKPAPWPLWRGIPLVTSNKRDPFRVLAARLETETMAERARTSALVVDLAEAEHALTPFAEARDVLRQAAILAADRCDPGARNLALRFLPHARWFVYVELVSDPSGRIAQLAESCPGALVFAHALAEKVPAAEGAPVRKLLADIRAGRRLARALDDALEAWFAYARRFRPPRRKPAEALTWQRVREASLTETEAILRAQRLLIRRATASVPSTLLWLPPPADFAPEDIPASSRGTARWFRVVKTRALLGGDTRIPVEARAGLSRFLSRHSDAIVELAKARLQTLDALRGELVDYIVERGRYPDRASSIRNLIESMDRDRDPLRRRAQLAAIAAELDRRGLLAAPIHLTEDTPLPQPLPRLWGTAGSDRLCAIETLGELIEEGERMRHCVAQRGALALGSRATYWSARIGNRSLTVEVLPGVGGWHITEVKGHFNREPVADEWRALNLWIAAVNCGPGVGPWIAVEDSRGSHARASSED